MNAGKAAKLGLESESRTRNTIHTMTSRNIILGAGLLLGVAALLAVGLDGTAAASNTVIVYKSPSCGCCAGWVDHMKAAGFDVEVRDVENLNPVKDEQGVYPQLRSCHTALVGGYVVEGHVPAEQVTRLLAEKPAIRGIAVPGMPMGSPGMEQGDPVNYQDYQVVAFDNQGEMTVYAEIKAKP